MRERGIETRGCNKCGTRWEVLYHRGEGIRVHDDSDDLDCPKCGSADHQELYTPPAYSTLHSTEYPRFDRGLGMWLTSETQRKAVCAAKGLVPLDGADFDHEKLTPQEVEHNDLVQQHRDHMAVVEDSSEYAGFRTLRDKGYFEDQKKELFKAARERQEAHDAAKPA